MGKPDSKEYEDPVEKLHRRIDKKLGDGSAKSVELQKVQENLGHIQEMKEDPVKPGEYTQRVFGVETVDMSVIEMNNIWDRSIFTTDKLSRMFLGWTIDQLTKYEKKKRHMDSKLLFLLILVGFGGAIAIIMFFLMFGG